MPQKYYPMIIPDCDSGAKNFFAYVTNAAGARVYSPNSFDTWEEAKAWCEQTIASLMEMENSK
jgi:hypothetical protein